MENEELRKQISSEVTKWFEELDQYNSEPFLPDRKQPITPESNVFDE